MKNYNLLFVWVLLNYSNYVRAECIVRMPESFRFLYLVRTYGDSYRGYTDEEIELLEKEYRDFDIETLHALREHEKKRKEEFYARRYAKNIVLRQAKEKHNQSRSSDVNVFDITAENLLKQELSVEDLELDLKKFEEKYLADMNIIHNQEVADYQKALNLKHEKIQHLRYSKIYTLPVERTINGNVQKLLKNITITQGDAPGLLPGGTYMIPLDFLDQKNVNTCNIRQVSGPRMRSVGE